MRLAVRVGPLRGEDKSTVCIFRRESLLAESPGVGHPELRRDVSVVGLGSGRTWRVRGGFRRFSGSTELVLAGSVQKCGESEVAELLEKAPMFPIHLSPKASLSPPHTGLSADIRLLTEEE